MKSIRTTAFLYALGSISLTACIAILSLSIGTEWIPPSHLLDESFHTIVWELRAKRILIALLVGGSLAGSGSVYQIILKNPLADPYILGISSAAALGATVAILLGLSSYSMSLCAFLGATTVTLILFRLAVKRNHFSSQIILLTGVLLSFLFSSLVVLSLSLAQPFEGAKLLYWLMGTVSNPLDWRLLFTASIVLIIAWGLLYRETYALNILNLGEDQAQSLGLSVQKTQRRLFIIASFLTAIAVSLAGTIGFVGLILPHMTRTLFGGDQRLTLPITILGGGGFLILADSLIRGISTQEIPIGVITALLGAPCFLLILWRGIKR